AIASNPTSVNFDPGSNKSSLADGRNSIAPSPVEGGSDRALRFVKVLSGRKSLSLILTFRGKLKLVKLVIFASGFSPGPVTLSLPKPRYLRLGRSEIAASFSSACSAPKLLQ